MKKDFYRFIYAVLLKLSNRFPNKLLIRYKLLFGTLLLGATAATTAKATVQNQPADLPSAHYIDPSPIISITGTHITDTTRQVIKGRVMDAKDGTPIGACTVRVMNTANGTVPDEDGNFTLTVTGKDRNIVVEYLGYETVTVQIEPVMEIFLEESEQILCYETVVVYYEKKKTKKEKKKKNILEIKGKVTDMYNEEIIGASIVLNSTGENIKTDLDGQFSLAVPINKKEETTITVSCLGFVTQTIPVEPNMQIILEEDDQTLECYVTITGFGATKKRVTDQDHPAAVQTIRGRVTDEDGEPLIGVQIKAEGTTFKTSPDQNGYFTLSLPGDIHEVNVSCIGFEPQTVPVDSTDIIRLKEIPLKDQMKIMCYTTVTDKKR